MIMLLSPFIFVGFTSKLLTKRLTKQNLAYQEQSEIDYLFATLINSINLEEELNDNKKGQYN